jgi:hypothetical protein
MPFNDKNNTVSYYDFDNPLPTLTKAQGDQIPDKAQILQLKGGNGGRLGEKSFKPQIIFAQGEVTDGGDAKTSQNINTYEFGSENDCGFAVKINEDVNNKSQVNIGYINSTSAINIYLSGNDLQFTKLISGSVETSTSFADGVTVKDFTVSTNGTSLISSVLDTDLGLNKYYFDIKKKYLKAIINDNFFYLKKNLIFISNLIDKPQEYKRFSNFNNKNVSALHAKRLELNLLKPHEYLHVR